MDTDSVIADHFVRTVLSDDGENHPLADPSGYGSRLGGTGERTRQWANVRVSFEILRELLKLPAHASIVATMDDRGTCSLLVRVESPDFAPVPDGFAVPTVRPHYRSDETRVGNHTTIRAITFVGWE